MKKIIIIITIHFSLTGFLFAQSVGINNAIPDASAVLDIKSNNKGLLIPRMNTTGISSISNPAKGLLVLDTSKNQLMVNLGTSGSPNWQTIVFKSGWNLTGNSNIDPLTNFIGTNDANPLLFKVNNLPAGHIYPVNNNTSFGLNALSSGTPGTNNTATGFSALISNTSSYNTATGGYALTGNTTGSSNTANGYATLYYNSSGYDNTASGYSALTFNTVGKENTANGFQSLFFNTDGEYNTANGSQSLFSNTGGKYNSANGSQSLFSNTAGNYNTANGYLALYSNTGGFNNTASGASSLFSNTTGQNNTASGYVALYYNTGNNNTAVGVNALGDNTQGSDNTAIGSSALGSNATGNYNTALGYVAGNSLDNLSYNTTIGAYANILNASGCTAIGYNASTMGTNNLIVLGAPPVAFTGGYTPWTNFSDGRFKKNINEEVKGLDFIMRLRPVTYHMDIRGLYNFWGISPYGNGKIKMDKQSAAFVDDAIQKKEAITMTGFVAQEVEKAAKESNYNFDGVIRPQHNKDHYRIAYEEFVVPLVKGMQEQQAIIEKQQKRIDTLEKRVAALEK